jgi:hypothetical protein
VEIFEEKSFVVILFFPHSPTSCKGGPEGQEEKTDAAEPILLIILFWISSRP